MRLKYILVFIISVLLLLPVGPEVLISKTHKKSATKSISKTKSKSAKSKDKKKSKKKRKKYHAIRMPKETGPFITNILKDSVLAPGIVYKSLEMGRGKCLHNVHILETDITNPENALLVLKAKNTANELEKLHEIINNSSAKNSYDILCAVNANFWQAYTNRPIGPTVVNGEVVEISSHKRWSSGFFDEKNHLIIDNFMLSGIIRNKKGREFIISNVNRRRESTGIVQYNRFSGDTLPEVKIENINDIVSDAIEDMPEDVTDSTEEEIDTAQIRNEIISRQRLHSIEFSLPKLVLVYLTKPPINKTIPCRVIAIDTGAVPVPNEGCVISVGNDIPVSQIAQNGDTLYLELSTNVHKETAFMNSVSGSPRLIRDGEAKNEAMIEGSRARRFIYQPLARTAIGTNREGTKIYLTAIEPTADGRYGASLSQLSEIMKNIGAYNAMNLDGGGSSIMVIDNKNLLRKLKPDYSRRISVGLAAARRKATNIGSAEEKTQ